MNNKAVTFALVGFVALFFACYYALVYLALGQGTVMTKHLQELTGDARSGRWQEAIEEAEAIRSQWNKARFVIMINYSVEDYTELEEKLQDIQGAVLLRDDQLTVMAAYEAMGYWRNMMRLLPEP